MPVNCTQRATRWSCCHTAYKLIKKDERKEDLLSASPASGLCSYCCCLKDSVSVQISALLHRRCPTSCMNSSHADANGCIQLNVYICSVAPPIFTEASPPVVEVLVGGHLFLPCVATGNPSPAITWLKDGHAIQETNAQVCMN